jgi:hypothetical protein
VRDAKKRPAPKDLPFPAAIRAGAAAAGEQPAPPQAERKE